MCYKKCPSHLSSYVYRWPLMFYKAHLADLEHLLSILKLYKYVFEQTINLSKSSFLLSPQLNNFLKKSIMQRLSRLININKSTCLVCHFFGEDMRKICYAIICVKKILLELIHETPPHYLKLVVYAWSNQLPIQLQITSWATFGYLVIYIKIVKVDQSRFWWEKKSTSFFCIISWENICKHKYEGGLGKRKTSIMNLFLLAKVAWRIMSYHNCLVPTLL